MSLKSPKLWVVATPLGNPGDLSPRAREVLEGADTVLAEDTRRAGLLCQRCGVKAKRFMSFHDHNEESKLDEVLGLLTKAGRLRSFPTPDCRWWPIPATGWFVPAARRGFPYRWFRGRARP